MSQWAVADGVEATASAIGTEKAAAVIVLGALAFLVAVRTNFARVLPRLTGGG